MLQVRNILFFIKSWSQFNENVLKNKWQEKTTPTIKLKLLFTGDTENDPGSNVTFEVCDNIISKVSVQAKAYKKLYVWEKKWLITVFQVNFLRVSSLQRAPV